MIDANMPNTFITDDGQIIFCNAWEFDDGDLAMIAVLEARVNRIEKRYGTKNIERMMLEGISKKEMNQYIIAKRDLLVMYGIG